MVKFPDWVGVAMVVGFFGLNGIWLAYYLLWQRARGLFWLACALMTIDLAYVVLAGAAIDIARSLWPVPFDEVRGKEILRRTECMGPTPWMHGLIAAPVALGLVWWLRKERRLWVKALGNVGGMLLIVAIIASPLPDKLAQLIAPDAAQKLPAHCLQRAS